MTLSISTKELLEAAKFDAPSNMARDAMWTGIQTQAAAQAAASTVVAAKGLGVLSSKLVLGIALGVSIAGGAAAVVFAMHSQGVNAAPAEMPQLPAVVQAHTTTTTATATMAMDDITVESTPEKTTKTIDKVTAEKTPEKVAVVAAPATPVLSEQDRLAREARTVSEARGALRRGEPEVALRLVRAERHKHGARLIPEELNVEIQALRAMGDEVGARAAEAELAGKYPEQSLAH